MEKRKACTVGHSTIAALLTSLWVLVLVAVLSRIGARNTPAVTQPHVVSITRVAVPSEVKPAAAGSPRIVGDGACSPSRRPGPHRIVCVRNKFFEENSPRVCYCSAPFDPPMRVRERKDQHLTFFPSFFLLGFPKCGTSALTRMLTQHPAVYINPKRKEQDYFSTWIYTGKDRQGVPLLTYAGWLHSKNTSLDQKMKEEDFQLGEASTEYTNSFEAPYLVQYYFPDARFVVMVRSAAEQVYSQANQRKVMRQLQKAMSLPHEERETFLRKCRTFGPDAQGRFSDTATLTDKMAQSLGGRELATACSIINRSLLAEWLYHWFSVFPRDQFLVLRQEELMSNPAPLLARIETHLGVRHYGAYDSVIVNKAASGIYKLHANETASNDTSTFGESMPEEWKERLTRYFEQDQAKLSTIIARNAV